MAENCGWCHPEDLSDQWDGFNDSGIDTFAGTPIRSLAREVNQNALDAGESGLVDVKIKLHDVETSGIPDLEDLRAILKACYDASKKESRKAAMVTATSSQKIVLLSSPLVSFCILRPCTPESHQDHDLRSSS